jgi:Tfp pilus assembly protein PilN
MLLQQVPVPPPIQDFPVDPNLVISQLNSPAIVLIVAAVMAACTIVLWPLARALARRIEGKGAAAALQGEIEQLHQRLSELDGLQSRVAELEERLDFAERLLAKGDAQTLPQVRR